jgi:hypothetical protein
MRVYSSASADMNFISFVPKSVLPGLLMIEVRSYADIMKTLILEILVKGR